MERVDKRRTKRLFCKKEWHQKFCWGQIRPCWGSGTTHPQLLRCPLGDTRVQLKEIEETILCNCDPPKCPCSVVGLAPKKGPRSSKGTGVFWFILQIRESYKKIFSLCTLSIFLTSYLFLDICCNIGGNQLSVQDISVLKLHHITAFIVLYDLPWECSVCTGDCS